ncbi:MAG: hypothetical protein A2V98_08655 [Planctomycetes bacterium RBG_16_64_12]|nr:MAG: hypothetical protein A2V98_08655 [Planctomycetes bacterium RBG_16_64_12]
MEYMTGVAAEEEMGLPSVPAAHAAEELTPAPLCDVDPTEQADHFDTGPVWDEENVADAEYRYEYPEDEYSYYTGSADKTDDAFDYGKWERERNYADSEDRYDDESESASEEHTFDRHNQEPEYREYESAYGYDYDRHYMDQGCDYEYAQQPGEATEVAEATEEESEQTECTNDNEGWVTEYGNYKYDSPSEDASDDFDTSPAVEVAVEEAEAEAEQTGEWQSAYDYGTWKYEQSESAYDSESEYASDAFETSDDVEPAVEETEPEQTDVSEYKYEYDAWATEYGEYKDDCEREHADEESETAGDVEAATEEAEVRKTDRWEYEYSEYDYAYPETRYGYSPNTEEDSAVEVGTEEEATTGHQGYCDAYPEEEYAYPEQCDYDSQYAEEYQYPSETAADSAWEWEVELEDRLEGEPGEVTESTEESEPYSYHYADPCDPYGYDCYGNSVGQADKWIESSEKDHCEWTEADQTAASESEPEDAPESGLELFAWRPADLLLFSDQEILRSLETLCEEPSGVRRAKLNEYVELLGWEAIDFASRFEDATGIEVLGLADDLPGTAAFLGVFRLIEQGELGMDEAVHLLRRSLGSLSLEWIEGVGAITADAFEDWDPQPAAAEVDTPDWSDTTSASRPVVDVMVSLATRSLAGLGSAISSVSRKFSELDWQSLAAAAVEGRAASHTDAGDESLQR